MNTGDIVWVDFDPTKGHEQNGRRPAVVLSPSKFIKASGLAAVCPITSKDKKLATNVPLPEGMKTRGFILTAQVRTIDVAARSVEPAGERVSASVLSDVHERLSLILGMEAGA